MNQALIRFGGVELSHNPKKLSVQRRRTLRSVRTLSGGRIDCPTLSQGEKISGTGELFGESCEADYLKLLAMCGNSTAAVVSIPCFGAFRAVLTSLTLAAEPKDGYIAVDFTFTAAAAEYRPPFGRKTECVTQRSGVDLWDIAYECGCDVSRLVELNPHIRNIRSLKEGERVKLC